MTETMYLLDNNVLGPLGNLKETPFFANHCRVPAEVAYESRKARHAKLLVTVEMNSAMLLKLAEVMATVPAKKNDIIDLYENKGAADPILVAMARVLDNPEMPTLLDKHWVIVSRDKAVINKAKDFGVETKTLDELREIIERASAEPMPD